MLMQRCACARGASRDDRITRANDRARNARKIDIVDCQYRRKRLRRRDIRNSKMMFAKRARSVDESP
ncbi:hypothetical protein, partial [Bradyrhizobium sp.]|uniref:hypothetical protein n=1 Tax=Bradyrhizobium sp. TaxID=376 RepID=UPI003C4BF61E